MRDRRPSLNLRMSIIMGEAERDPLEMKDGAMRTVSGELPRSASTSLLTDRYELTMLDAARESGVADHRAVFELFARRLPAGRRYGVVSGVDRIVEAMAAFSFGPEEMAELEE